MQVTTVSIPGLLVLEPKRFGDARGFFLESYNKAVFDEAVGAPVEFVQDNHSRSAKGVLRGLHYQVPPKPQGKLVRVARGEVWDVAVDIRRGSPTFGRWEGVHLSADNGKQFWIPEGFAHGFVALTDDAELLYKTTGYYAPDCDRAIAWNDPDLAIAWPLDGEPLLSGKDQAAPTLKNADLFP